MIWQSSSRGLPCKTPGSRYYIKTGRRKSAGRYRHYRDRSGIIGKMAGKTVVYGGITSCIMGTDDVY
ncbi:hypothetical protein D4759_02895 [Clostridiales bacterium AHG0011]|nr:hypothetical protein [Clostridiales bacterium AHG0011]